MITRDDLHDIVTGIVFGQDYDNWPNDLEAQLARLRERFPEIDRAALRTFWIEAPGETPMGWEELPLREQRDRLVRWAESEITTLERLKEDRLAMQRIDRACRGFLSDALD